MSDKVGANTVSTLNGHFKETYADRINDLRPDGVKLLKMIDFIKAEKQPGNFYHQPVMLGHEHGFTYGGSAGNAFLLEEAIQSAHGDAQVRGTEIVLRSYLSVAAASRSQNSKAAFISETKLIVENMMKSFAKRLEICLMYGHQGIGAVESVTGQVIKILDHEFAAGIWSAGEGAKITVLSAGSLSNNHGEFTISGIDLDTKEITVIGSTASVEANDVIFFKTSAVAGPTFNEFVGLHKIITNTGTLFNINASSYNLWKGNVVDVGTSFGGGEAVLTMAKIEEGVAKAMNKGLTDEDVTVIVSTNTWKELLVEQTTKRSYDSSYSSKELEDGSRSIKFYGPNGIIEVVASIYCKEGYAYAVPVKEFMRVGSSDITFEQPGFEGKFLRLLENHNGYEMRAVTDQALFTSKPGLCVLFRYIK
jgi:hypothetical protein